MSTRWAPWNAVLTGTRTRTGRGGLRLIVARLDRRRNRSGPPRRTGCRPRWPGSIASSDHAVHERDAPVQPHRSRQHPGRVSRLLKQHGRGAPVAGEAKRREHAGEVAHHGQGTALTDQAVGVDQIGACAVDRGDRAVDGFEAPQLAGCALGHYEGAAVGGEHDAAETEAFQALDAASRVRPEARRPAPPSSATRKTCGSLEVVKYAAPSAPMITSLRKTSWPGARSAASSSTGLSS